MRKEQLNIRIDDKLKKRLVTLADKQYTTVTQMIIAALLMKHPELLDPKHDHLER